MSEHINVDHAFDPEARKAQAELDGYLESRPYQDENGMLHEAGSNKFTNAEKVNAAHDAAREAHYELTLSAEDYGGESLEQLARRVADARAEGDKTRALDAEDAFFEKFTAMAEKYGWEEDDSADEAASFNHPDVRDRAAGRSTIDDRLARYSKIMYGEDAAQTPQVETESPAAAKELLVEAEKKHVETEAKAAEVKPAAEKVETFDVDAEAEQAKERLNQRAEELEQQASAKRSETESAKADRELLARVSKEGLEDDEAPAPIAKVSTEGLEDDGPEARETLAPVSTEGLEEALEETENVDEEATPERKSKKHRLARAWKSFSSAFDRASYELGAVMTKASYKVAKRGGKKEGETDEAYEARQRKYGRRLAVGIVAVAGASLALKLGADIDTAHAQSGGHIDHSGADDLAKLLDTKTGGDESVDARQYSRAAMKVSNGEGWFQTFKDMGIPKDKWNALLEQVGPKLTKMDEGYRAQSLGGYGINGDGHLSRQALDVIADTAKRIK